MRLILRMCAKVSVWISKVYGIFCPPSISAMIDCLYDGIGGERKRTWPGQVAAALAVVEKTRCVEQARRISMQSAWTSAVDDAVVRIRGGYHEVKRSLSFAMTTIAALQDYVVDVKKTLHKRGLA